jgi:glyoxylate reductase
MDRPRVFVTTAMRGLEAGGGRPILAPLIASTRCEIWAQSRPPSPGALRQSVHGCEGLLCLLTDRVDEPLMATCPTLRVISSCSVGVDHIDVAAASARGIAIGNTPGVLTETTAELAFALLMAAARRVVESDRALRAGAWTPERRWELDGYLGRDLYGATLGIIGLGPIGQAVARRAAGFGMRVLGWSRSRHAVPDCEQVELSDLLARSDFVSVHVALADETQGLLDAEALGRMKRGAILINTARGGVVDQGALADALREGQLGGAGIDVFEREPIEPDDPLLQLPNVILTPHIGSASIATRRRMAELAVENLLAGLEGREMPHRVTA